MNVPPPNFFYILVAASAVGKSDLMRQIMNLMMLLNLMDVKLKIYQRKKGKKLEENGLNCLKKNAGMERGLSTIKTGIYMELLLKK